MGALCLFLMGCQKEVSDLLQGKWQLKTIDSRSTIFEVDTVWYNFQSRSLFMYQIYAPDRDVYIYQYGYKTQSVNNDSLYLELAPVWPNYNLEQDFLPHTDWSARRCSFKIERVNHKSLVLSAGERFYHFRRF